MPLNLIQKETRTHEQKQQSLGNTGWCRGTRWTRGTQWRGWAPSFADLTVKDTLRFSSRKCHLWTEWLLPGKKFPIPPISFPFSIASAQISASSSQLTNTVQLLAADCSSLAPVCSYSWFFYLVSAPSMQHSSHSTIWKSTFASAFNVFLTYGHFFKSANLLGQVKSSAPFSFLPFPLPHQKTVLNDLPFAYPLNDHLPTCAFET